MKRLTLFCAALLVMACNKNSSSTSGLEKVSNRIDAVKNKMNPASLGTGSSSSAIMRLDEAFLSRFVQNSLQEGEQQCGSSILQQCPSGDLFALQPCLLRLYLCMAKNMVAATKSFIQQYARDVGTAADGSSGTVSTDGYTGTYSKTSDTNFNIEFASGGETVATVNVTDNLIEIHRKNSGNGFWKVDLNYTSDTEFEVNALLGEMGCDDDDERAPERFWVRTNYSNSQWVGKAGLYNGIWRSNSPTCSMEATDDLSIIFYTDYVATDLAAKVNVYTLPRNLTSSQFTEANASTYAMSAFCTNFGCGGGSSSAYSNPFCSVPSGSDVTATWGNSCSATDPTVSSTSFGSFSNFYAPVDFYQIVWD